MARLMMAEIMRLAWLNLIDMQFLPAPVRV
jgi:hypothetical protein